MQEELRVDSGYWKKVYEEEVGQVKRLLTGAGYPVTPSFFTGLNQMVAEVQQLQQELDTAVPKLRQAVVDAAKEKLALSAEVERLQKELRKAALDYLSMDTQAEEAYQKQLAAEKRVQELEAELDRIDAEKDKERGFF